ncbi:hypothetical protein [Actinomarinicola tropica]|uniref:Uncharacterized protein n=1 Tax=Actinomarinicola tropica TaxID=2789776 RepID=A0A5Q2RMT0_9ACTN|nr:hypothetical protein [Actinomarinicola tropica]QGG95881.1 hypothetical protein GH723_12660 [Actinomarinicola tropica]
MPESVADEPAPRRSGLAVPVAAFAVLLVVAIGGIVAVVVTSDDPDPQTVTYAIDEGTGARLDAGEDVDLMPAEVHLSVGDTLVIRNDDDRPYSVGPYFVRAGETLAQTYTRPQELVGACELSGHGELRVVVT